MNRKGLGQYDLEYAECPCFWGTKPGKYILKLMEYLKKGSVLDLGAGEGKNAIYMARQGFEVHAVECSEFAVKNFNAILKSETAAVREKIKIIESDVRDFKPVSTYDAVIAYGLLHCLPSLNGLNKVLDIMAAATRKQGLNVIVTFTDTLGVPTVQGYLEPTLIPENYLENKYNDWNILLYENDIIEESHPTSNILHKHSVCRLLAKKYD